MDDMTAGEIGRALERLERASDAHGQKLDDIKEQTTRTNGRVDRLEDDVREIKRDREPRTGRHEMRRVSDKPDATTFTIPNSMLRIIVIGAIAIGTALATIIASFLGMKLPTVP